MASSAYSSDTMKLISAVIRPKLLPRLTSTLRRGKVPGVTVFKAQGFGREQEEADTDLVGFLSEKVKVEIAVEDDDVDRVMRLINEAVATGREGDGIIFVMDIMSVTRISRVSE